MMRSARLRLRLPVPARPAPLDRARLELAVDARSTPVRVLVRGDVCLATAAQLRGVLDEVGGRRVDVVIDCAAMTFIDRCGLGVLAAASRRMGVQGHVLGLAGPNPLLRLLLDHTGLGNLLPVEGQRPLPPQRSPPRAAECPHPTTAPPPEENP